MPISSGFGYYQIIHPTRKPIVRPQIVSRAPKFRDNQRNQNGLFSNSKATAGGKLPPQRPTAVVKQPPRSNTFIVPTKRDETNLKVPKINQAQNGSRRQPPNEPAVINSSPPAESKSTETMRKNGGIRPMLKQPNSTIERKPVRFANNYNNTYYSSSPASPPPVYYQKSSSHANPLPRDALDQSRRTRITNDDYIIRRQKDPSSYAYTDYHTVSDIPTISYGAPLPPITPPMNQTGPTVIIHSKDTFHPDTPSYPPPPPPVMILPQSGISSYPQTSTMFLPSSAMPSYSPSSTMIFPSTAAPNQQPTHAFMFQPPSTPTYVSQPFFYPIPYPNPSSSAPPPPPPPPQPPAPPQQTIISQSSSSSVSAPQPVKVENITEERNATIIVRPNTTNSHKKNVTIQLKLIDEDRPQRLVRVVHDSPYREDDNVYYVDSEPKRIIYEQPTRRTAIIRRPPANEYVYVDESPPTVARHRSHRPEVVYVNDDRSLEYEEEIVYVDDNGTEIDYIYDDEPVYHRRGHKKSRQPSSTNIVYE